SDLEALSEMRLHRQRGDEAIDDNVVVPFGTKRSRIADQVDLQRRGSHGKYFRSCMRCVAVEIEQDVDAVIADTLHDRRVGAATYIGEVLECVLESRTDLTPVLGQKPVGEGLDAVAIQAFP